MSTFEVKVQPIFIKQHPDADKLQLGNIGSPDGWQVVVAKDRFQTGDLCAYIGENAIVPEAILKFYGYWNDKQNKGMLAGSKGDRVKAVRLRGEFSLGIVLPVVDYKVDHRIYVPESLQKPELLPRAWMTVAEGDDVAEMLHITKHEPPIPVAMAGEVYNAGTTVGVNYDIENIKNYPDILVEGEDIQVTEKIHGTFCQICVMPHAPEYFHEDHFVVTNHDTGISAYIAISSKGLGGQGLFLKDNDKNANNVYVRTARKYFAALTAYPVDTQFTVCGEVFGNGVQDLTYGYKQGETDFRLFDVYVEPRGVGRWMNDDELDAFVTEFEIPRVPLLYRGPYSRQLIEEFTQHTKSVFDPKQVREGVVIKPMKERRHSVLGRVILKSINTDYLLRKGNTTEYN